MMYVKLFEGFDNDDYYMELNDSDFYNLKGAESFNCVSLSKEIRKKLRLLKYIPGYYLSVLAPDSNYTGFITIRQYANEIKYPLILMMICEIKDEWYLVREDRQNKKGGMYIHRYWKCDQVEGVIRLLEDTGMIVK